MERQNNTEIWNGHALQITMQRLLECPPDYQLKVLGTNAVISVLGQDHSAQILDLLVRLKDDHPDEVENIVKTRIRSYSLQADCIKHGLATEDDFKRNAPSTRMVSRAGRGCDSFGSP